MDMIHRAVVLPLLLSLAPPALASDAAAGLQAGTLAPQFMLPVVNALPEGPSGGQGWAGGKKWGPGKWTGAATAPAETKKLVVMSFFATYCDPCKKEMPELARLYDKYKDQGLGVMLVSIDKGDEQKQQIVSLAKTSGVTFPVLHDRFQVVARRYAAERLPYMLMLDATGAVKNVHIGYTDEVKANLENEVRGALGLPPLVAEEAIDMQKDLDKAVQQKAPQKRVAKKAKAG